MRIRGGRFFGRGRGHGAATPNDPNARNAHSTGDSDVSSVAQAVRPITTKEDLGRTLYKISEIACCGDALSEALSMENTVNALETESMQNAIFDLNLKFEAIQGLVESVRLE